MPDLYENKDLEEQVILVGVATGDAGQVEESLDELEELAETAGAKTVGRLIQNREMIHPGTYLGKGKLEELAALIAENNATGIICDDELSPAQMANMEDVLDTKVMDRTLLILDIFAQRACTKEGKIQVELAQLRYRATRLVGKGSALSRLGGGIGTRGPGEKKLEVDRRRIHDRISQLKGELRDVTKHREVTRARRNQSQIFVAAIVGYTNAGKSTLLNTLTEAGVLSEDKLFATLDPTTRELELPGGDRRGNAFPSANACILAAWNSRKGNLHRQGVRSRRFRAMRPGSGLAKPRVPRMVIIFHGPCRQCHRAV